MPGYRSLAKVVKRPEPLMNTLRPNLHLQRRRIGAVALALVSLLAIMRLRASCETLLSIGSELAIQSSMLGCWFGLVRHRERLTDLARRYDQTLVIGGLLMLTPWCLQVCLRIIGHGTGWELIAMSSFAWATVLCTLTAQRQRGLGTSVVCSGFLTLSATCSSDKAVALLLAWLWGALCLWWLASSHWDRAQRCQVSTVVENRWQRPIIVLAGCLVFALSAWSVAGRFPPAQRLPWEIAPTSGGTSSNDEFARSGVGDGDALVAARENAASFGAVDSDLMLDSKEASLFDLYSDTFGEPIRKQDTERTVALAPQQQEVAQLANMAQSDGASAALTTQRRAGTAPKPMANRASDALLFWIGRPNSHLALEKFSHFDGIQWLPAQHMPSSTQADHSPAQSIRPMPAGNHTWFSAGDSSQSSAIFLGSLPEAIKFARLKSPRIPAVAGMHSWHIHRVDDASFFHVDENDNLSMPGRKSVPEFTIVRYINREIDLQALTQTIQVPRRNHAADDEGTEGQRLARATLDRWLVDAGKRSAWDTITLITDKLRQEFHLERATDTSTSPDPLADFLTRGAGNDLMFATAAASMLKGLGHETRLVTGFVAKAENRLGWSKELAIYAQDTHAWLEVQVAGQWIPLEPSPGFPLPNYHISWRYWFGLHAWKMLVAMLATVSVSGLAWWQQALLFDCLCHCFLMAWWLGNDRQRCRWLLTILDCRSRLTGCARPAHVSPQRWYAALANADSIYATQSVAQSARIFFREADRLWFGNQHTLSETGREACRTLWTQSTCRVLRSAMQSPCQPPGTSVGCRKSDPKPARVSTDLLTGHSA